MINERNQPDRAAARPFTSALLCALFGLLFFFMLADVGTWLGITQPSAINPFLLLLALLMLAWVLRRRRQMSQWHSTPLDLVLPLWLIAFEVSTAANWSQHANILTGLWFSALYILLWYVIYDALANHLIRSQALLTGLLLAGIPILVSALLELKAANESLRISGLLRNPNILAAFLILLIPLLFGHFAHSKGAARIAYGLYFLVTLGVFVFTQSRGGVLGIACSFGIMLALQATRRWQKAVFIVGVIALAVGLLALRGDSGRLPIYDQAVTALSQRFLTGQGLFTFRTFDSPYLAFLHLPPDGQNLHAHNIWLEIGVELGVLGIAALTATILQFARVVPEEPMQRWCLAAFFGLLAQQMVDFTIMTPAIAVCALVVLALATRARAGSGRSLRWPVWLLALLALLLILAALAAGPIPREML